MVKINYTKIFCKHFNIYISKIFIENNLLFELFFITYLYSVANTGKNIIKKVKIMFCFLKFIIFTILKQLLKTNNK